MLQNNAHKNTNNDFAAKFFGADLASADKDIFAAIGSELTRQQSQIELIASENIVSRAVLEAQGSVLTNKYAEGYPNKRYYGGCEFVDQIEQLAIDRAKQLFNCNYANVQPNSGSQANQAVFMSLISPGDTIMGLSLACGGHLTHGAAPNMSGKWFNSVQYGVSEKDSLIDYDEVRKLSLSSKPKLIIAGCSAYPRIIDWKRFRQIADEVGAFFMVDMAHMAGLIAAGVYPSPLPHAHVVTTTTHKTLRGPRGGLILSNFDNITVRKTASGKDVDLASAINSAVFPGLQGGPLMHVIAGKAIAFGEALSDEFKHYGAQIISNAKILGATIEKRGLALVSGGTDSHVVLVDLRPKNLTGKLAEESLERAGLTCNKNAIPFDPQPPFVTSGVRLGTPAGTTRGFRETEFEKIGNLIGDVFDGLAKNPENNSETENKIKSEVAKLCNQFPIYNF